MAGRIARGAERRRQPLSGLLLMALLSDAEISQGPPADKARDPLVDCADRKSAGKDTRIHVAARSHTEPPL
jgi:hypothetical protein